MQSQIWWTKRKFPGQIAIVARPRGGDWLEDETQSWANSGLDAVVSLLTNEEMIDLDIEREAELSAAAGLKFYNFPITDRDVPKSRAEVLNLIAKLEKLLLTGKNVGIHCRQGIGRSALIAAALFVAFDVDAATAFREISEARGLIVPETAEQHDWLVEFAAENVLAY